MPHDARAAGSGASADHIALLLVCTLVSLACAGKRTPGLEALLEESRELREIAWDARSQASRARARAGIAEARADSAAASAARSHELAAALDRAPRQMRDLPLERADRVIVHKSERRLELYREGERLRSFPVALGFDPVGPKRRQGDGRTPEGSYTLTREQTSRYGPGLLVSYPHAEDVRRARAVGESPGGAIFIHGLPLGLSVIGEDHARFDWTNGCIAVSDAELEEIWARVADGTPIEIAP
jgi:murein L,D-transpeptidase YafK